MPWPSLSLRTRREQARDSFARHLPGADATVPNSILRALGEAFSSLTYDNDRHLDWVARMMMPDTAEGAFAERWGNIWLRDGRKPATGSSGLITVTGGVGATIPTGAVLTATVYDAAGGVLALEFEVVAGLTLATTSGVVAVESLQAGAFANLDEGAQLSFIDVPTGVDGSALVAFPGLAGAADQETDAALVERYIARIQEPPHGGADHDYVAWALEVPGVTRAWAKRELGVGTMTVRIMLDGVRASSGGLPLDEDRALVLAHIDKVRPTTVAQVYVPGQIAQPFNLTISDLIGDTPEVRANIRTELNAMLRARAAPGRMIYASWIREAISAATGEDHHDLTVGNQAPASAGHMITLGTLTFD